MDHEISCLDDNRRYLSASHVYCLANMLLRRPIVVYARENANGAIRGIYMPTLFEQCYMLFVRKNCAFDRVASEIFSLLHPN
jgi:hypothetical protein